VTTYQQGTPWAHVIDQETLREVPTDPGALAAWVAAARATAAPAGPAAKRRYHTELGVAARLAGDLDLAEQQLTRALELASTESPTAALRARIRLAHVQQWRGRHADAARELAACVADAVAPPDRGLAHQHAGWCAYDAGDVDRAAAHFQAALRSRVGHGADAALVESSRTALDAADACRTAIAMAEQLDRLVVGAHHRTRDTLRALHLVTERPPHFGTLVELRGLLLAGVAPDPVIAGLFRYHPGTDAAIAELVATGWLARTEGGVTATPRATAVLDAQMTAAEIALYEVWGAPDELLARVEDVARCAVGTSEGPVFDALATVDVGGGPALRLFERLNALRQHRADAHAAAWQAAGLTATSAAALPLTDPVRRDVETTTNRIASRPYRRLSTVDRTGLVAALRQLPV
jgi:Tfp pilus assembly protein PilF